MPWRGDSNGIHDVVLWDQQVSTVMRDGPAGPIN
jgi:hypothetical protein